MIKEFFMKTRMAFILALIVGCESADQIRNDAESVHTSYLKKTTIKIMPIEYDSSNVFRTDTLDMSDSIIVQLKQLGLNWKKPPTYSSSLFEGLVLKKFSSLESAIIFQIYHYRTAIDTVFVNGDMNAIEVLLSDLDWKFAIKITGNLVLDKAIKVSKSDL